MAETPDQRSRPGPSDDASPSGPREAGVFEAAFDAGVSPSALLDAKGRLVRVNPAFSDQFQLEPGEPFDAILADPLDHQVSLWARSMPRPWKQAATLAKKDGWATPGEITFAPLPGGLVLATLSVRSESAQGPEAIRTLQRRLADRERQLLDAVNAGLLGVWTLDIAKGAPRVQGRIAQWLQAGADGSLDLARFRSLIHPEDADSAAAAVRNALKGEGFHAFEYRLRAADGWRWVRTTGQVIERDDEDRPVRAAGVVMDISAERRFSSALKAEKRRFERIYQDTPALMQTIDAAGRTLMVSDFWIARMGYERAEVLGTPGWRFFTPEDQMRVREEVMPRSMRDGVIENVPLTLLTKAGEPLEVRLSAFWERDAEGRPLHAHGVFADVGDLNRVRRELETRYAELERVNRELNRFTTVASHDLQEPLRKISAFASLLRRRYEGVIDPEADQSLYYLVDAAGRMRNLIDDLLAYSRASSRNVEREPVDLGGLWREVQEGQDLQIAEAEAVIRTGDLPDILGDRVLLRLLLSNLLSNALKYRKGEGVRITFKGMVSEDEACLTFADDGIGFDPRFSEKIFSPFARLHGREEYAGTGIGLAICQQAVERQGGRIWVESAPGEGARFHFTLPAVAGAGRKKSA